MMVALFVLITCYALLIGSFIYGFIRVESYHTKDVAPKTSFSIVIPFRNEKAALPVLLDSLSRLEYPQELYEIILVDDASTDDSVKLVEAIKNRFSNLTLIYNTRVSASPKKDAIHNAIEIAKGNWILTTDADCIVPTYWLKTLDSYIQENKAVMIAGPIALKENPYKKRFLKAFESLDIASLLGATIGGFGIARSFMANGANLAYKKESYKAVGGFQGNDHIASGDDLFLLQKFISKNKDSVHYLKSEDFVVKTDTQPSWKALIEQRKRWASKTTQYKQLFPKIVGLVIFLTNLVMAIGILWWWFTFLSGSSLMEVLSPTLLFLLLLVKVTFDVILIRQALTLTKGLKYLGWYPLIAVLYPFVTSYIALMAFTGSYTWKGRTFKT